LYIIYILLCLFLTLDKKKQRISAQSTIDFSSEIPKNELELIECHFNWDIVDLPKSLGYFVGRIEILKSKIDEGEDRNLLQLNATAGYFTYLYYKERTRSHPEDNTNEESKKEAMDYLDCALQKALNGKNVDYQLVIYGNLVHIYNDMDDYETAKKYLKQYDVINKQISKNTLSTHPEVLAMKGFALNYAKKYERAIECYSRALENEIHQANPEWFLKLGFAKQRLSAGKRRSNKDAKEIEMLYRHAIQIDDTYDYARLKLARILWETLGINGIEEINYWIDQIQNDKKIYILEETAAVLFRTCTKIPGNYARVFALYQESEKLSKIDSQKTMRGLAKYHLSQSTSMLKQNKTKKNDDLDEDLNKAIGYYKKLTTGLNAAHYDKTKLANVYSDIHNNERYKTKLRVKYQEKCDQLYRQVLNKAETESVSDKIQIWKNYSCNRKRYKDKKGEIVYLKKVINLAYSANENIYGYRDEVEYAEKRLLELAAKGQAKYPIEAYKTKALVFAKREQFDNAIFCLEKALEIESSVDIQENLAQLYWNVAVARKEDKAIDAATYSAKAIKKIVDLPKGSRVKWELYNTVNRIEYNELTESEEDLKELRELRLEFEDIEMKRNVEGIDGDSFTRIVVNVIVESKRVLDASINHVRVKVYSKPSDKPPFCNYPSPITLQKNPNYSPEEQMDKLFKNVLPELRTKMPDLFNYLVDRQPTKNQSYSWLKDVFEIRNKNVHDVPCVSRELLEKIFQMIKGKQS